MAVSNTTVEQAYPCNGVSDTFAIPFTFFDVAQITVYLMNNTTKVKTLLVQGSDYVVDPVPDINDPDSHPTNIITQVVYPAGQTIILVRATPLTQIIDYINNSGFLATDHEKGLDRIVLMLQEVDEKLSRSIKVSLDGSNFDSEGIPQPGSVPVVKDDLTGVEYLTAIEFFNTIPGGGGVPPGGDTGAYIEKASAADGDADWVSGLFAGYSARYNTELNLVGLRAALLWIFNFQYLGPLVSLSGSSNVLREKGDAVTSLTLTAGITKRSDPIAEVRFYQQPSGTPLDTQTSGGGIPNGGNSTYSWTGSFSDNTTFRAEADDNGASGGPTTAQSTTTYSFVYPYYVGAGAPGLSASAVAALTKRIIASTTNRVETIAASNGNVFYFAYPASYGALTSILDVNNFETIGDWTLRTENITGLDGNPVSYRIYEFDNPVTAGSYQYTFKR